MLLAPTATTPYTQDSRYSTLFPRSTRRQHHQHQTQQTQQQTLQQHQFQPRVLGLDFDIALDLDNSQLSLDDLRMLDASDISMTPSDAWFPAAAHGQFSTPRTASRGRVGHQRDSSLSSLGSAGPASPYSHTTSNPHIAVTDSLGSDGYHGLQYYDDSSYQLANKMHPAANPDGSFSFASSPAYTTDAAASAPYAALVAAHKQKADRGLLSLPDLSTGSNRSRPVSVASSIVSDSPATPSSEHHPQPNADEMRRKHGSFSDIAAPHDLLSADFPFFDDAPAPTVPKLDRTMTDVYGDELYSPNFAITAAPSQQTLTPVSPSHNDMFVRRLQAANTHNLSATQSPVLSVSRGKSPFRNGSPLAPTPSHDFGMTSPQMRFNSAHQMREQIKAEQDAHALRQQMARNSDTGTPQTISPKDAILEYHDTEGENNFPLFGPQPTGLDMNQLNKASLAHNGANSFDAMALNAPDFNFNTMSTQLPTALQIPNQYPFVSRARNDTPSTNDGSLAAPTAMTRATSSASSSVEPGRPLQRPNGTNADGGTYTCTYHGCTQRFETPVLLQKHKREGHRSAHGPNTTTGGHASPTSLTSPSGLLFNSQAGPHRCDRINPSTGKPCHTIFSRPYDLTRHEDTIHNARKQKVRCDLCTEDKTFSRADALTRHYRVCHPDVDFPGKHRRGRSSG